MAGQAGHNLAAAVMAMGWLDFLAVFLSDQAAGYSYEFRFELFQWFKNGTSADGDPMKRLAGGR